MGVSKNNGTPKWMVYNGKPYEQMDDLGVPLFLETPKCGNIAGLCKVWKLKIYTQRFCRPSNTQEFNGSVLPKGKGFLIRKNIFQSGQCFLFVNKYIYIHILD